MRLICPNCGAQYEVPVDAIPAGGRDVQCSGCGHTWFELHPDHAEPALPESRDAPPEAPEEDDLWEETEADMLGSGPDLTEPAALPDPEPEPHAPAVPRRPVRARGLDPSVAEVLRQEAEREARRRTDPEPLESQPELGLAEPAEEDAAHRARVARAHMARIRGDAPLTEDAPPPPGAAPAEEAAPEPEHPAVPASRRDLLPDIEEINQSLRVAPAPRRMETPQGRALHAEEEEAQGSNFARGFGMILILAVLAVLLYALAPAITGSVPAAAPLLDPFVAAIDGLRLWLDALLGALLG